MSYLSLLECVYTSQCTLQIINCMYKAHLLIKMQLTFIQKAVTICPIALACSIGEIITSVVRVIVTSLLPLLWLQFSLDFNDTLHHYLGPKK